MGRYSVNIDENDVIRYYSEEKKGLREIAELFGVSHMTVKRILTKHNIVMRPKGNQEGKKRDKTNG